MLQKLCALGAMLAIGTAAYAALTPSATAQTSGPAQAPFALTSPKLQDGAFLDKHFAGPGACGGDDISLPLKWSNAPANTKSFAVTLYDFDGGHGFGVVHWIAYGMAPDVASLAAGEGDSPSPKLTGGSNMRHLATYFGPCAPASDAPHHYMYTIYALSVPKSELPPGLNRDQFLQRVKGRVLGMASLVSLYRRSK